LGQKIPIQNIRNDECSYFVFKLSSTCSHTHSKSLSPLCNCFINYALVQLGGMKPGVSTFSRKFDSFASPMHRGPILLKCEVIGVSLLLNMGQKISRKQYVSTILTIHLNTGIKEVKFCSSKYRHTTCRTSESRDARLHSTKFVAT